MNTTQQDLRLTSAVFLTVVVTMGLVAYGIGANAAEVGGHSSVTLCALLALGVQLLAWFPASLRQTERFYDLTGGLTYLAVVAFSLWAGSTGTGPGAREWLISGLVAIWAIRLASFLYLRIHRAGKDGRFDELKTSPIRFLIPWSLQAMWVFLTLSVVVAINCQALPAPSLGIWDGIGLLLWGLGFGIEVVADAQKTAFNAKPENRGKWIDEGLWSRSRHPNYFGEILLWIGIACFGIACLDGWERLAWISPVFVLLLLTKISGVPLLDKRSLDKWGEDPDYQAYRAKTRTLLPL